MEQGTKEWLEFRKGKIGSSDIPVIMGVSPWKTRYELWLEMTGRSGPKEVTRAMERGRELEPIARDLFCKQRGIEMSPQVLTYMAWMKAIASLDGITIDGVWLLEVKCPSVPRMIDELQYYHKNHKVSDLYNYQMQWGMMVSGAGRGSLMLYYDDEANTDLDVVADKELQEKLLKEAKAFMELVEKDIAPETEEEEYILIEDEGFETLASEYVEIDGKIKELESMKRGFKSRLIEYSDDGNVRGGGIKIRRSEGRLKTMWEKVVIDFNISEEDLERYQEKGNISWTIYIEKEK